jgi:hypothetical protein
LLPTRAAGTVIGYLYGLDGAVPTTDVSSANWNITGSPATLGLLTGEPLGVLPDTVQIGPLTTDAGTGGPGFASATNQPVPVNYSAKMKANSVPSGAPPGTYGVPWALSTAYAVSQKVQHGSNIYVCTVAGTSASSGGPTGTGTGITDGSCTWNFSASGASPTSTGIPTVQIAISAALGSYLPRLGPGGIDQVSGAGVVYTPDLQDVVKDSIAGLYNVVLTVPSVGATAVPLGSITVAGAVTGTITVAS